MRRIGISLTGAASCLVLAATWGILALPGPTIANPPPHNHGGEPKILHGCVTIDSGPAFTDDGSTLYCHIEEGVTVELGSFWRFRNDQIDRKVLYDYSGLDLAKFDAVEIMPPTDPMEMGLSIGEIVNVATGELTDGGLSAWTAMAVGDSHRMRAISNFDSRDSDGFGYSLVFGFDLSDDGGINGLASALTVTRTGDNTWTIASTSDQVFLSKRLAKRGKKEFVNATGFFNFTITYAVTP